MNYWIFVVTSHKEASLEGEEILRQRLEDKFWGLGERTPNRKSLQAGDEIVFYVGNPKKVFAASAIITEGCFEPKENERERLSHGKAFYRAAYGVRLGHIRVWDVPRRVEDLVTRLDFIENKEFWGPYFQGGVKGITEQDFRTITDSRGLEYVVEDAIPKGVESSSQFALETHLEEFIDKNWEKIDFRAPLSRYQTEDQTGRQFPAGTWSIDFLCTDKRTGEFVVIELKRGKSSDSTVGQILRYIGWVKDNLAQPNAMVRGIIIAKDVDESLRQAVKYLDNVRVLTYRIDFTLLPENK